MYHSNNTLHDIYFPILTQLHVAVEEKLATQYPCVLRKDIILQASAREEKKTNNPQRLLERGSMSI